MSEIQQLIHWHPALCGMVAMWLFTNVVTSMPTPSDKAGEWYTWMFRLLHALAAGLPRLIATAAPSSAVGKLLVNGNAPNAADTPKA